jgi:hypothetical protein
MDMVWTLLRKMQQCSVSHIWFQDMYPTSGVIEPSATLVDN